jgi:hypothetical protein
LDSGSCALLIAAGHTITGHHALDVVPSEPRNLLGVQMKPNCGNQDLRRLCEDRVKRELAVFQYFEVAFLPELVLGLHFDTNRSKGVSSTESAPQIFRPHKCPRREGPMKSPRCQFLRSLRDRRVETLSPMRPNVAAEGPRGPSLPIVSTGAPVTSEGESRLISKWLDLSSNVRDGVRRLRPTRMARRSMSLGARGNHLSKSVRSWNGQDACRTQCEACKNIRPEDRFRGELCPRPSRRSRRWRLRASL